MPLYEYTCEACGTHFEMIRKFSDPPVETCLSCGGPVRKLIYQDDGISPEDHWVSTACQEYHLRAR